MIARPLLLAALAAGGPALAAEPPAPGGLPDVVGPRSLALSAGVGMAASNEGMFLNPAGVGARKRYSIEAGAFVDRRGAANVQELFGGSVVDSMSSPLTGGIAYFRSQEGSYTGNVWNVLLSAPIGENVFMGFNGRYLDVSGEKATRAVTVDAGLYWQVAELVSFGAAGYNLVPIANEAVAPMGVGVGLAIGNDRLVQLTADWRSDFDRTAKTTNSFGAGLEVLVARVLPLRAGFLHDDVLGGNWWSAGAGLVSQSGVAIDVGYRQSFDDEAARTLAANLKLFLFR